MVNQLVLDLLHVLPTDESPRTSKAPPGGGHRYAFYLPDVEFPAPEPPEIYRIPLAARLTCRLCGKRTTWGERPWPRDCTAKQP